MKKFIEAVNTIKNKVYLLQFTNDKLTTLPPDKLKGYLSHGGDPNLYVSDYTILDSYCLNKGCYIDQIKLLLEAGADPNKISGGGENPINILNRPQNSMQNLFNYHMNLHSPIQRTEKMLKSIEILELYTEVLLQYGSDPNAFMNREGMSSLLSYAVTIDAKKLTSLFLQHGARVDDLCLNLSHNSDITAMLVGSMTLQEMKNSHTQNPVASAMLEKRLLHETVTNAAQSKIIKI